MFDIGAKTSEFCLLDQNKLQFVLLSDYEFTCIQLAENLAYMLGDYKI